MLKTQTRRTLWRVVSSFLVVARGVHDLEHSMYFQCRLATIYIFEIWVYSPSSFKDLDNFFPRFWPCGERTTLLSKQSPIVTYPSHHWAMYIGLWSVVVRGPGAQHPEHLHFFSTKVSPRLYFWHLNIFTDTHLFSKIFNEVCALRRADTFALSNPSSSTYSLLCEIAYLHTVARHHLWLSRVVCSTLSTWIFFQSRSVTICFFGIQTHELTITFRRFVHSFSPTASRLPACR